MPPLFAPLIFSTSFVVGLSGALMPGPLLAMSISEAGKRGFWAGPILIVGHSLTEAAMVVALALGLSQLLKHSLFPAAIGILGGIFLLGMGYQLLRPPPAPSLKAAPPPSREGPGRAPLIAGILMSLANPYWFLWWATVGASYVVWALGLGVAGLLLFYLGHILSDFSWYSLVTFLVSRGRGALNPKAYRSLGILCGLFLLALGGYFLYSGVGFLQA